MAKKSTAKTPDVIDVPALNPTSEAIEQAVSEANVISTFFTRLRGFMVQAEQLETRAKGTLATAKTWRTPTSKEEDEALVAKVRGVTGDLREAEETWTVTTVINRFHRRMTAKRSVTTDALDEAKRIGDRLHNDWTVTEQRRVDELARKQREEDDRIAREKRDRELAEMEQRAIEEEAKSPTLSAREARFVDYLTGPYPAPARAAQQAGYPKPDQAAAQLLGSSKIQTALEARRAAIAIRDQAAAHRAAPVETTTRVAEKPQVAKGSTTTLSAEVFDEEALIVAMLDPMTRTRLGIPTDILTVKAVRMNDHARSLGENINRWPGVRLKKTTGIR